MSDPNTVEITVDMATKLTKLVATYGIYALVIIYMFYLQRRERMSLAEAETPAEQAYYRKRGTLVLWVTILLSGVAAGVWFYDTFLYEPKIVIEGTLKNLREQPTMPAQLGDPPMVTYRLDAFRGDVQFYSAKQASLSGSSFDLDWALISPRGLNTLQLIFQQEFCSLAGNDQMTQVVTLDQNPFVPKPERGSPIKTARIDFRVHEGLLHEQIHLIYQPDADIKKIGRLFVVHDAGRTEIPWDEDSPAPTSSKLESRSSLLGTGIAWAQDVAPDLIFGSKGEISSEMLQRLKIYLESEDLKQQLVAQDAFVQGGARSFAAAKQILQQKSADHHSRNRLVHNIASAMEKIEALRGGLSPAMSVVVAQALFEIGDYELAARFFSNIPESHELSIQASHQRAISYVNSQHYDKAEQAFRLLLKTTDIPNQKSAVLTNLGVVYARKGKWGEARNLYKEALALQPRNVVALTNLGDAELNLGNLAEAERALERAHDVAPKAPHVLNNLAYTYALQGKNLDQALSYIDQALSSNGEIPKYLDTKGWILYKRGQPQRALEYLDKAYRKEPENNVIKTHVEEVRGSLRLAADSQ